MKHPTPTAQEGVATWTVATCHPIPAAILDDMRQHLDRGTQVRVLLRLPAPSSPSTPRRARADEKESTSRSCSASTN